VQNAAAFVAIDGAKFGKAHRQIAVAAQAAICKLRCGRGNSWA